MKKNQLVRVILVVILLLYSQLNAESSEKSNLSKVKNFFDRLLPNTLRPNYFYNTGFIKYVKFPYKFTFKDMNDIEYEIRSTGINKNGTFQYNLYKDDKFYTTSIGDTYYDQIRFLIPVDVFSEHGEINTYQCFAPIKKNGELEGVCSVIAKNEDGVPESYVDQFTAIHFDPNVADNGSVNEQDVDSVGSNHKFRPGLASRQSKL